MHGVCQIKGAVDNHLIITLLPAGTPIKLQHFWLALYICCTWSGTIIELKTHQESNTSQAYCSDDERHSDEDFRVLRNITPMRFEQLGKGSFYAVELHCVDLKLDHNMHSF